MLDSSMKLVDTIVSNTKQKFMHETGRVKIEAGVVNAERCGHILQDIVDNVAVVERMTTENRQRVMSSLKASMKSIAP